MSLYEGLHIADGEERRGLLPRGEERDALTVPVGLSNSPIFPSSKALYSSCMSAW